MSKHLVAVACIGAIAILSSCIGRPANVQSAMPNEPKIEEADHKKSSRRRTNVTAVDATGSYGELVPALRRLARFAGEELREGDTFCAFWIKGGIGDSVDFLIEPVTLPVPQRRIGDPVELDVLNLKQKMQGTILSYAGATRFKKAGRSDVVQAIAFAGRLLHATENSSCEKWLLLFTDLEDNQKMEVTLNLQDVHVRVFYVPARNDLNGLDKKIAEWKERFTRARVASAEIYNVGQSAMLTKLISNQPE